jgi:hypothetical protein
MEIHSGVVYAVSSPVQQPLMSTVAKKAAAEKESVFIDRDRKRYFNVVSKWTELIEEPRYEPPILVLCGIMLLFCGIKLLCGRNLRRT